MWGVPWRVDPNHEGCDGFAVVKKDTGKLVACHPTREKANAQMRALYANEARTAAAIGELAAELLEETGEALLAAPTPATIARRRAFDESKVARYPKGTPVSGPAGGGRFKVKTNASGRFEVVAPNGKKVAETTDEAEAQDLARNRNVETSKMGQIADMPDDALRELAARRDADAHRLLVDEKNMSGYVQAKQDVDLANDELTRRQLAGVEVEPGLRARFEEIERKYAAAPKQYDNTLGTRKITPLGNDRWEVSSQDGSYGRHEYPVFRGSRDDVMRFVQRDISQERDRAATYKSFDSTRNLPGIDTAGRPSLAGEFSKIPNEWAVEQGYAVWNDPPDREPGFRGRHDIGDAPTIRWRQDVQPERVLVHYLGGRKPPADFPLGSKGWEQFMYGRKLPPGSTPQEREAMKLLRGRTKADRAEIARRLTAALAACGFVVADVDVDEALVAAVQPELDELATVLQEHGHKFELWEEGLTAAVEIPDAPPRAYFEDPGLDRPTPLTVTSDGRVYGHLALWDSCHIGDPGGPGVCVAPPRSSSGYTLFHLGEVETAEGEAIPVGKITLGTGHASLQASRGAAAAHYDNTGSVVADVRAGEDRHGIWFSGALRKVTSEAIRALRASQLSGDWRRYRNGLELVAALAVNTPGFPVPRVAALVSPELDGDDRLSLVAAGIFEPLPMSQLEVDARIEALAIMADVAEL